MHQAYFRKSPGQNYNHCLLRGLLYYPKKQTDPSDLDFLHQDSNASISGQMAGRGQPIRARGSDPRLKTPALKDIGRVTQRRQTIPCGLEIERRDTDVVDTYELHGGVTAEVLIVSRANHTEGTS